MRFLTKRMQHKCVNITKPQDHTAVAFIKTTAFQIGILQICSLFGVLLFSLCLCLFFQGLFQWPRQQKKHHITFSANYMKSFQRQPHSPNDDRRLASELELPWFARPHSSATEDRDVAFIHSTIYKITIWYFQSLYHMASQVFGYVSNISCVGLGSTTNADEHRFHACPHEVHNLGRLPRGLNLIS